MTPRRSYYWLGIPYGIAGVALLAWAVHSATWSWTVLWLLAGGAAIARLDRWAHEVTPRLIWSSTDIYVLAALVLAPGDSELLVSGLLSVIIAVEGEPPGSPPRIGRVLVNFGQLAFCWAIAAQYLRAHHDLGVGPSVELVSVVVAAFVLHLAVNVLLLALAVAVVQGLDSARAIPLALLVNGPRSLVVATSVALIASAAEAAGPALVPLATVLAAAIPAMPLVNARLDSDRAGMVTTVAKVVDGLGPGMREERVRLTESAYRAAVRLRFRPDQISQLTYLSILYSATAQFSGVPQQSVEEEFAGKPARKASWALTLGLPVSDLADERVIKLIETASRIAADIMGDDPTHGPDSPIDELVAEGFDPRFIAALQEDRPLPQVYDRIRQANPKSLLLWPIKWMESRTI
jgi:hypothetical protein